MKFILFMNFFCYSLVSHAGRVEDVKVLDIKYEKESFVLKLQIKDGKPDSYFTVEVTKDDPKAFEKLAFALKKSQHPTFKLDLNIPSFSPYPSGSFYKSLSVTFIGELKGESLLEN